MSSDNRPTIWIGSSLDDLKAFPREVQSEIGTSLREAQEGKKPRNAKPMDGSKGATVMKIVADHDGDTFRAVYTVRFTEAVYVLHCFQKKSKSGIATPRHEIELVMQRLKRAEQVHKQWQERKSP